MDKILYLAEVDIEMSEYMGRSSRRSIHRIVWASSLEEAEVKVRAAFEKDDPYGTSVYVVHVELSEAIA